MPYSIKENGDGTVRVVNSLTGKVHAKSTSREDAEAQIRIMKAADKGHRFGGKRERK